MDRAEQILLLSIYIAVILIFQWVEAPVGVSIVATVVVCYFFLINGLVHFTRKNKSHWEDKKGEQI
jgi:hypothetical protein